MRAILKLPLLLNLVALSALAMWVPMAHAVRLGDMMTARIFLQYSILILVFTSLTAVAVLNYKPPKTAHSHLFALLAGFFVMPFVLALPFSFLMPDTPFLDVYFEMLSSLTTTGATVFTDPTVLSDPLHLWRGLVGWLGGFMMWVAAIAIMAPLNLGGFEIFGEDRAKTAVAQGLGWIKAADPADRLIKYTVALAPIYLIITLFLTLGLVLSGERFFVAVIHAMSTIATSGISSVAGLQNAHSGLMGEVLIFGFLIFAVSRLTITPALSGTVIANILRDREFRLMMVLVCGVSTLLFLRHWLNPAAPTEPGEFTSGLAALWGSAFTVMSFLTTTGFESANWQVALDWSGLKAPGMILLGLAIMGGGIATTAGGIKLLRVYALYKHGLREMQKLSFPASVGGSGTAARRIRREGAYFAWIFFMLFVLSAAMVMLGLSLTGIEFENAIIMAIAALSTTGPLVNVAQETAISFADISDVAKIILGVAMILGRLETLAIIALLNPEFWQK